MLSLMQTIVSFLRARFADEHGEVSIEYVLVGGLAAAGIVAGMALFFPVVGGWFKDIYDLVSAAI